VGRIQKAYETQFRWRLRQAGARRLDQGVNGLVAKAQHLSASQKVSLSEAFKQIYEELARKCRAQVCKAPPPNIHFFCDAGLGGLARWLRAAGYEARWEAGIDDDELLKKAAENSATILTTDSMLMERRLLRDRIIPALWLPPTLRLQEQLVLVFRELGLAVRPSRCMNCGGNLLRVDKETMRERIPPKTYLWLNEYFVCNRCGKLFWHGTHWQKILGRLQDADRF
jgi:uncharacterized protein